MSCKCCCGCKTLVLRSVFFSQWFHMPGIRVLAQISSQHSVTCILSKFTFGCPSGSVSSSIGSVACRLSSSPCATPPLIYRYWYRLAVAARHGLPGRAPHVQDRLSLPAFCWDHPVQRSALHYAPGCTNQWSSVVSLVTRNTPSLLTGSPLLLLTVVSGRYITVSPNGAMGTAHDSCRIRS